MKFYRVESTELLSSGVGAYTFFVLPEGLDGFIEMFEKHKEIHTLGEPELVDIEIDSQGNPIRPEGLKNISLFVGT